jgi:hypothetical protein
MYTNKIGLGLLGGGCFLAFLYLIFCDLVFHLLADSVALSSVNMWEKYVREIFVAKLFQL